jgi:hypothetical protein
MGSSAAPLLALSAWLIVGNPGVAGWDLNRALSLKTVRTAS